MLGPLGHLKQSLLNYFERISEFPPKRELSNSPSINENAMQQLENEMRPLIFNTEVTLAKLFRFN